MYTIVHIARHILDNSSEYQTVLKRIQGRKEKEKIILVVEAPDTISLNKKEFTFVQWQKAVVEWAENILSMKEEDVLRIGDNEFCEASSIYQMQMPKYCGSIIEPIITSRLRMIPSLLAAKLISKASQMVYLDAFEYIETIVAASQQEDSQSIMEFSRSLMNAIIQEPYGINQELTENLDQMEPSLFVAAGGIGVSAEHPVTLDGGSDVTVASLAIQTGATTVSFIRSSKDMTYSTCCIAGEPALPEAMLLTNINYEESIEIGATNSNFIHPGAIKLLRDGQIGIVVQYVQFPKLQTIINEHEKTSMKCVCVRSNVIVISMQSLGMWQTVGFLKSVFEVFDRFKLSVDYVGTSETNVTVTLDQIDDISKLGHLKLELEKINRTVDLYTNCAAISLIGSPSHTDVLKHVAKGTHIYLISKSHSDVNLSLVVDQHLATKIAHTLHQEIISNAATSKMSITENVDDFSLNPVSGDHVWWQQNSKRVIESITNENAPLYIYNLETIREQAKPLQSWIQEGIITRAFYAMKANPNVAILKTIESLGLGFECVSPEEVRIVLNLFPSIDRKRILFTPNFCPEETFVFGLSEGVNMTVDNIFPLQQWAKSFENKDIWLRIDPGFGLGHHDKVKTGGVQSKFGIPISDLFLVASICEKYNIRVVGLHTHKGSGILKDHMAWKRTAELLSKLAETHFPHVETLDLGGGFGVPYRPTDVPIDMRAVANELRPLAKASKFNFVVEPGRYLVGPAGIMVARCTQTKSKGDHVYVGLETGMNSLIRPSLYDAYHEITNLTPHDDTHLIRADFCGPVCETGDMLGFNRQIHLPLHGDVFVVATCGAYGAVMASRYNQKPFLKEVIFE